jgi:energy-coupling factor transporter ATP-binding protein EcfA2
MPRQPQKTPDPTRLSRKANGPLRKHQSHGALNSWEVLTSLRVKNFKRLKDVEIELGQTVVFIGPNNSGKTTALQALALWEIGLRKSMESRGLVLDEFAGVAINRRDLIAVPVPAANLLWRDLQFSSPIKAGSIGVTQRIPIEILVTGLSNGTEWKCGFKFEYANQESFSCRPIPAEGDFSDFGLPVPDVAAPVRIAFLPPMSGLAATEDYLQVGALNVRIGEGRTAEVLRNLCYQVLNSSPDNWAKLVGQIQKLFGVSLKPPEYISERGQITMSYEQGGNLFDLVCSGRGLQQTLLLLAHLYTHPNTVLLLDEPDAHLEILRQRHIYQLLTATSAENNCQLIMASHSEVILSEAADRDIVIAFLGKPHRINDRGSQLRKSLNSIGFDQYYQAEQTGWILYLEGSTDLAILRAFAETLEHPARAVLEQPFVHYIANDVPKARDHFFGLRAAKRDLVALALFDSIARDLESDGPLVELKWQQNEIENYLCFPETLLAYARQVDVGMDPAQAQILIDSQVDAMTHAIQEVSAALEILGKPKPFGPEIKASDDFLQPVFQKYFALLNRRNLMQKTDYHVLARLVARTQVDPEVENVLDRILDTARSANPAIDINN